MARSPVAPPPLRTTAQDAQYDEVFTQRYGFPHRDEHKIRGLAHAVYLLEKSSKVKLQRKRGGS